MFSILDIAFIGSVAIEGGIHDPVSFGVSQEFAPVADESAGRNREFQAGVAAADGAHIAQFSFALAQLFNNRPGELIGHVNISGLHRLQKFSVLVFPVEDLCLAYGKLISFPAHILDQDGKMEFSPAGNLEAVCAVGFFHP